MKTMGQLYSPEKNSTVLTGYGSRWATELVWMCGGVKVQLHTFLTSAVVGGECSASCSGRIDHQKMIWKEGVVVQFEELSCHLLGGTEKNYDKSQD
jgi:hypothetical protein